MSKDKIETTFEVESGEDVLFDTITEEEQQERQKEEKRRRMSRVEILLWLLWAVMLFAYLILRRGGS